jgi:hypothetical protein
LEKALGLVVAGAEMVRHADAVLVLHVRIYLRPAREADPVVPFPDHGAHGAPQIVVSTGEGRLGIPAERGGLHFCVGVLLSVQFREGASDMARKSVHGTCAMCRKRKLLCKSHYFGRAVHNVCNENGQDAVMMTPKVVMATQRQLWAHLLCLECEGRLNKFGETPVLKLLDNGKSFPLLDRMKEGIALKDDRGTLTFSGKAMGIDTAPIAHFGLGVLWKGGVHKWNTIAGQTTSVDLEVFEEPIRKYLLGKSDVPEGVCVLVGACEDKGSRGMVFAPSLVNGSHHRMFSILVRGIWFHIVTDMHALPGTATVCCVKSDLKVLHMEDCNERFLHAGRHIHKTARVSPNAKRKIGVGP